MKKITSLFIATLLLLFPVAVEAQPTPTGVGPEYAPNWYAGYVPSPYEWQVMWSNKLGVYPGGLPISLGGCGATTAAGCLANLGAASLTLSSGQMFVGNASNVTTPVTPTGDWTISNAGLTSVTSLSHVTNNTLANSGLVSSSTSVNGQSCSLGSTCTVTAAATSITPTVTTVSGGTPNGLLWNSGGFVGNIASGNNGVLITNGSGTPAIVSLLPSTIGGSGVNNAGTLTWGAGGTIPSGSAAYQSVGTSGTTVPLLSTANTWSATQTFASTVSLKSTAETYTAPTISGGALTFDLSLGTVFNVTNNASSTITIINPPASKATAFTVFFTANGTGYTQTFPGSVKWPGGSGGQPVLSTTSGVVDVETFISNDGGTTWFGFVGGQAFQ